MRLQGQRWGVAALCAGTLLQGCASHSAKQSGTEKNVEKEFYADGALSAETVKQAYFEMFERFNYPVADVLKTDEFWVCDFNQGDVLALGMGGIFWMNEQGEYKSAGAGNYKGAFKGDHFGYLMHEIYLLPGQTLPEHAHLGGPEGHAPKMEAWQVRYGDVRFYGEHKHGDEMEISELAKEERPWGYGEDWFKSKYITHRDSKKNIMYKLEDPEAWHGIVAGKDGAIITEGATYHNHVHFSKPGMEFKNTGAE